MRYSIRSDMMAELTPKSPRLVRHILLCRFLRILSWFFLPVNYLGLLMAPAVILSIPFQIFHYHHFSPYLFWTAVALVGTFTLGMFYASLVAGLRLFRQRVIYLEAIVLFAGLMFAVVVVVWIFPPK